MIPPRDWPLDYIRECEEQLEGISAWLTPPPPPKCDCGAHKIKDSTHSDWCSTQKGRK
jgi:hypothetical protein